MTDSSSNNALKTLICEYAASDEVVIDVSSSDIEEAFATGKSDGDIRGTIMQDVPLYRVIDDLGISKIRETGKITSGDWSAPAESEKGAQFGFDLDDVIKFGLAHNKQRWFRHDDPDSATDELGPKTYYPGRLRGGLWILEVNAAFNSFYTMSHSGRDKLIGNVNPFANPGDKKFDQETYDLIQIYLVDKSKENSSALIKHLSRLNLRLSKTGCDTGLGCSIDVDTSDVIKVHKIEIDDAGGHSLVQMAMIDALRSIEGKDVSHKSTPFDPVEESTIREYINEICGADTADLEDALATAQMAHLGQTRRSGEPYIEHPIAVANIVQRFYPNDQTLCAIALLHDTLEDAIKLGNIKSTEDMAMMIAGSFGDPEVGREAVRVVRLLTHASDVPYDQYVIQLINEPHAMRIKLADMLHNLQSAPSDKQITKYANALQNIINSVGGPPPEINSRHWAELMSITKLQGPNESTLRQYIRNVLNEANEYNWQVLNKSNAMLDREGMEKSDRENVENYLQSLHLMSKVKA